jgi:alpha-beta hydrolase superfamily lysophospholipase
MLSCSVRIVGNLFNIILYRLNDSDITKTKKAETIINTSLGNINLIHFMPSSSALENGFNDNNSSNNNDRITPTTILCIHGSYSDARIFNYIGTQLSENGFNVYSMDMPGHGKSDGKRGDLNFDACLDSINEIIRKIKGNSHIFILAHSIGCTFALWYAHSFKKNIDGLILMAPYIRISTVKKRSAAEPGVLSFLYLILRRILTPSTQVLITDALPNLTNIGGEELSQMLQRTDLNFYYSYRYIVDIIALRNSKVKQLSAVGSNDDDDNNRDISILLLHGRNDLIFFSSISEAYFKLLKTRNKKIKLFDCNHWFDSALSYKEKDGNDLSSTRYPEESRKHLIMTIGDWINENSNKNKNDQPQ